MTLVSGNIRYYADTRRDSSWRGPQMRVGLLTTAIFGELSGYFFGTSEIRPAMLYGDTLCWPVTDCKMNDLE